MTDKTPVDPARPGTPAHGDGQGAITAGHGQTQANSAADAPKSSGRQDDPGQKMPVEGHAVPPAGSTAHEHEGKPGR
jgi:hypothetical protein